MTEKVLDLGPDQDEVKNYLEENIKTLVDFVQEKCIGKNSCTMSFDDDFSSDFTHLRDECQTILKERMFNSFRITDDKKERYSLTDEEYKNKEDSHETSDQEPIILAQVICNSDKLKISEG